MSATRTDCAEKVPPAIGILVSQWRTAAYNVEVGPVGSQFEAG